MAHTDGQGIGTGVPATAAPPLVSIVIVCMDNMENLRRCLTSLKPHTSVSFETLVVAYLFTPEHLAAARAEFPWAIFIESNEIRGFSENNNLALREARGRYCLVLNDDTWITMPAVDRLAATLGRLPESAAIVSPVLVSPEGRVLVCGKPPRDWLDVTMESTHLPWGRLKRRRERYCGKTGVFRTYNITGAAFMAKTDIFRSVGWFDEYYFFAPEDIALSTLLNEKGYECYVDADAVIVHNEGMTSPSTSPVQTAVRPAGCKGGLYLYSHGKQNVFLYYFLAAVYSVHALGQSIYHFAKSRAAPRGSLDRTRYGILASGDWHVVLNMFNSKTPKEIFIRYYRTAKEKT